MKSPFVEFIDNRMFNGNVPLNPSLTGQSNIFRTSHVLRKKRLFLIPGPAILQSLHDINPAGRTTGVTTTGMNLIDIGLMQDLKDRTVGGGGNGFIVCL